MNFQQKSIRQQFSVTQISINKSNKLKILSVCHNRRSKSSNDLRRKKKKTDSDCQHHFHISVPLWFRFRASRGI